MITLVIMDGYGLRKNKEGNAALLAKTPNLKKFGLFYPSSTLQASGKAVGLPAGTCGNSEAGHLTIGSGRIMDQPLEIINRAITDGSFFNNEVLLNAVNYAVENDNAVHIISLISTGGVHGTFEQTRAMLNLARFNGAKEIYLHCILDGRDSDVYAGIKLIKELEEYCEGTPCLIASIVGRAYAMDREEEWDRTETAYKLFAYGKGKRTDNLIEAVEKSYNLGITDEFIKPIFSEYGKTIKNGDTVIFTNLRKDRARQLVSAFVVPEFDKFKTKNLDNCKFTSFVEYDDDFNDFVDVAFKTELPENVLGQIVSIFKRKQLRIAETTKFPHVTYYLNGGRDEPFIGEMREHLKTIPCLDYADYPHMRAFDLAKKVISAITDNVYDLIVLNLSNCDMVGHTGNLEASIRAVEVVDQCVGAIAKATLLAGGECVVTADHGNVEEMLENGQPKTSHTCNPVPFYLITNKKRKLVKTGGLSNIAPTVLDLMGLPIPTEMDMSLLK